MKKISLVLALGMTMSANLLAQDEVKKGDYSFLMGQKELNIEFVYDGMTINKSQESEEEYVTERTEKLNAKKSGKGDKFADQWVTSRKESYEPRFLESMNEYTKKGKLKTGSYPGAEITMIVATTQLWPGVNLSTPCYLFSSYTFVNTESREEIATYRLDKIFVSNSKVTKLDYVNRVSQTYEQSAKVLGKSVVDYIK